MILSLSITAFYMYNNVHVHAAFLYERKAITESRRCIVYVLLKKNNSTVFC
jgi:hypothetical protein